MMIWKMRAACCRGLATVRRACAVVRQRPYVDIQLPAGKHCDLPSCTIALVGITQATDVLAFDFRSR